MNDKIETVEIDVVARAIMFVVVITKLGLSIVVTETGKSYKGNNILRFRGPKADLEKMFSNYTVMTYIEGKSIDWIR